MDEQLDLFAGTAPGAARRNTLGSATVTYVSSRTLLTPASGFIGRYDFTLNPYSGCGFGCEYCYARFFAATAEAREGWGAWVQVKDDAVAAIRRAQRSRGRNALKPGAAIYMSSVTDPYQPIEKHTLLTRRILEVLLEVQPRLTVQTRSPMVTRDIDVLRRFNHVRVNFTIPTDDERVRLRYEPHCPSIDVRLAAAAEVATSGIPIGISISPMLPIVDSAAFGRRIASVAADEYVTQFMKRPSAGFRAGSTVEAMEKLREDGWTVASYAAARLVISQALDPRPLLESGEGYAPAR